MAKTYQLTITVSAEVLTQLSQIAERSSQPVEFIASEMAARGAKDALYRANRNREQWQKSKEMKERLAYLESIHND